MTHQLDPSTFPLHGTRLIEASAGTGKTYTIAALYLRLVLGHGNENSYGRPLTPPEILVVTFTKAATQELRDRIRRQLTTAARFFRQGGDGDDFLTDLRRSYSEDLWSDGARALDQAAQWMDEAAIYTIHSWAQRMLRQHAFDSGSLFDLELEPEDQELLTEAACDYWRSYLYSRSPQHLTQLLDSIGCASPQHLLDKVRPLLNTPSHPVDDPFAMSEQRCRVIDQARQRWASDFDVAVVRLRQAQADKTLNGQKYRRAALEKWLDQLTFWVEDNGPLPDAQALEKLSYAGLAASVNKNKTTPEHDAYHIFDDLRAQLAGLDIESALLRHAADEIARRFGQEKQRRGQMGYDDLLIRLNDALQKPDSGRLAQVIQEQFPVALIDEFQDTDPVQYEVFRRIYVDRPQAGLFMIGDPKQAIYAFRGADIHTYLKARQATVDHHYTLGRNYRSTIGLVNAVNQIFGSAQGYPQGPFLFGDEIPFDAVSAQDCQERFIVDGVPVESIHFWTLAQSGPVSKHGEEGYLSKMAHAFASDIVRLLNLARCRPPGAGFLASDGALRALQPSDIAVLVRDGGEARAIRQALDQRRVRSVYLSDKASIFTSSEAKELLHILRACTDPLSDRVLRAALATSVLDRSLIWLDQLNRDEATWEAEVTRFGRYQRIWQQQGVLPMVRKLLEDFGVSARLLTETGGDRSLTNLLHLAELLQTAAAKLEGPQALVRWLAEMIRQPGSSAEEQLLRLESDEDLIKVITVHKSKGLEYPLVIVPFVCSFRQVSPRHNAVVRYHDAQGRLKLVQNPQKADLEAADRERLAEDLRLLYVALTRCRFACWLGIGVMGRTTRKGENSLLHLSALGYLLSGHGIIPTQDVSDRLTQMKGDNNDIVIAPLPEADDTAFAVSDDENSLAPALTVSRSVPTDWWIASYSAILKDADTAVGRDHGVEFHQAHSDAAHSAVEDQLQEVDIQRSEGDPQWSKARSIHHFPRGPVPGTFLHDLLEWAADLGFDRLADDADLIRDRLQASCAPRDWDQWVDVLSDWFGRLLNRPLRLPEHQAAVSLAELAAGHYQPELEFLFAAHQVDARILDKAVTTHILSGAARPQLQDLSVNGMLKGFIDLAFCHQGRYYVMDYKSNYLGENEQAYGPDALADAILSHRYDLQYVLYTLAMHRLLKSRLVDYDYRRDMGGAVYVFLRGADADGGGVFVDKPPWPLIEQLDSYFAGLEDLAHA